MSITLTGWCTVNCTLKRLELSTRTLIFQFSYEKTDVSRYVFFFSRRFKYLNLRVGPLQYILWLGTNGGLGELFQDVWQFRRNVDLLWTINGFVLLRHNSPFQNKMLMYRLHGRNDCMKSRWRVFGYYDDTKQYSRQALRVEKTIWRRWYLNLDWKFGWNLPGNRALSYSDFYLVNKLMHLECLHDREAWWNWTYRRWKATRASAKQTLQVILKISLNQVCIFKAG